MGASAIAAHDLRKAFGQVVALDGFDLDVAPGEVHGFVGPNGAGKSTAIRALLGQIRVDNGTVHVLGGDPWRDVVAVHRRLSYVPGDVTLWNGLTGGECIDVLLRLQGEADPKRRDELVERFDLDPTKRSRTYSKGNRQKVALVAAFAKESDLLLLDEPTSGLDPLLEDVFRDCVREARDRGAAVLLSSHLLSQVEALCDRITVIRAGRSICCGTLDALRGHTSTAVVAVTDRAVRIDPRWTVGPVDARRASGAVRTHLRLRHDHLPSGLTAIGAAGVRDLVVEPPGLDELFLSIYGRDHADQDHADRDVPVAPGGSALPVTGSVNR